MGERIKEIIYTTNSMESLNSALRKVTKGKEQLEILFSERYSKYILE